MRTVTSESASAEQQGTEELPERVREALGELAGAAKEGLMALSVGVGLGVLHELMEAEVEEVVGPKGKHALERTALRHGHEPSSVTLGARRVAVNRPRVRSAEEKHEIPLATFGHFTARDALTDAVFERMLAGVSKRRFARTQEPVGEEVERSGRSTSKSAVSRAFVARTAETLAALMGRRLNDVRLAVLMLDGIELKGRTNVVALGVTTEGEKVPLGLWGGLLGERRGGHRAARRPGGSWPRHRPGRALRARRRQGAAHGGARRARRADTGAALRSPQGAKRPRAPARARPPRRAPAASPLVGARRPPPRRGGAAGARRRSSSYGRRRHLRSRPVARTSSSG